ncbi:TonB family protein [Cupriavidus pampae]|uniref:TonB C-terminal domain-containing protein n=1 Tax=Cupriavidus pampae TaxID=659251 RepID=A0ABM8XCK0_9BURK|nr:TonB family protein [Cupriavidus pampae]CAG9177818.1 hypothetical protein LMG32289_03916 [Cupriavidus pampae]
MKKTGLVFVAIIGTSLGLSAAHGAEARCTLGAIEYPAFAKKIHYKGTAVVAIAVAEDGSVSTATLRTSSGMKDLDDTAIEAARNARCNPGSPQILTQRIDFKIVPPEPRNSYN